MAYQFAWISDRPGFSAANFFSFFTIQSNILAAAMLALCVAVRREERDPPFDAVRVAVTLYIAITGVVFALLLAGLQEELQTTIPWVDFVVHKLVPLVLVVDWLLDPPMHRLSPRVAIAWLVYPTALVRLHARPGRPRRLVPVPVRRREPSWLRRRLPPRRGAARGVCRRGGRVRSARQPSSAGAGETLIGPVPTMKHAPRRAAPS